MDKKYKIKQELLIFMSVILMSVFSFRCATQKTQEKENLAEIIKKDNDVSSKLVAEIDQLFQYKKDEDIENYLNQLVFSMTQKTAGLKGIPLKVSLIHPKSAKAKWHDYSVAGLRIYLSKDLVKNISFEHELAAAISFELGHAIKRHFLKNLEVQSSQKGEASKRRWLGEGGVLEYSLDQDLEAIPEAIRILYQAGYDPRGLQSLWVRHEKSKRNSYYTAEQIEMLKMKTRKELVQHPPLLNPIVRSDRFLSLMKRFKKL